MDGGRPLQRLAYETWDSKKAEALEKSFESSEAVFQWGFDTYGDDIVYACSFGAEAMVLLDLIGRVRADAHVVFLDTHLHFKETYELIEQVRERYPDLHIEMKQPKLTLAEQAEHYGNQLWERDASLCCQLRKIEPLKEAVAGKAAWLSGVRRDQSPARRSLSFINRDEKFGMVKVCPLIDWTWEEVWGYIKEHELPYNPLHDQGYPSIGCMPCTQQVRDGEDLRAGRWSGTEKTECGLHLAHR